MREGCENDMQDPGKLEARGGIEPPIMVLQTIALPLGDRATEPEDFWIGGGLIAGPPFFRTLHCQGGASPALTNRGRFSYRAAAACADWEPRDSLTMGAPMRLPHSVHEPS